MSYFESRILRERDGPKRHIKYVYKMQRIIDYCCMLNVVKTQTPRCNVKNTTPPHNPCQSVIYGGRWIIKPTTTKSDVQFLQ